MRFYSFIYLSAFQSIGASYSNINTWLFWLCCFPSSELKEAVEDVLPSLTDQGVTVLLMAQHCSTPGIHSFSDKVDAALDTPLPPSLRSNITFKSPAVYIYTSGTTGIVWAPQFHLITCLLLFSSSLCLVVLQDSLRRLWSIRTASSQLWLFYHRMASRPATSYTSTCPCTTQLDSSSASSAPLKQVSPLRRSWDSHNLSPRLWEGCVRCLACVLDLAVRRQLLLCTSG